MNGIKVILLLNGLISFICLFFRNNKMDDNVAILSSRWLCLTKATYNNICFTETFCPGFCGKNQANATFGARKHHED